MALIAGFGIAGSPGTVAASSLYVVPGNSLQVPAGGTVYLQVHGIALQPGASVPSDSLSLAAPAQQPPANDLSSGLRGEDIDIRRPRLGWE